MNGEAYATRVLSTDSNWRRWGKTGGRIMDVAGKPFDRDWHARMYLARFNRAKTIREKGLAVQAAQKAGVSKELHALLRAQVVPTTPWP